jgi:hypothetical protein
MREVLSRAPYPESPASDSLHYELRLDDCSSQGKRLFRVTMARARWRDSDRKIVWDECTRISFLTLQRAEDWYAEWHYRLELLGFTYSDLDS